MKIHKIILKDYQQFKDLEIDLTYPAGHEKAGQPLEKVCFIGQSGTGKTTLLRLIKYWVTNNREIGAGINIDVDALTKVKMVMGFENLYFHKSRTNLREGFVITNATGPHNSSWFEEWKAVKAKFSEKFKPQLINFPTEILSRKQVVNDRDTGQNHYSKRKETLERLSYLETLELAQYIDFAVVDSSKGWDFVLSDIKKHQAKEIVWKNRISKVALADSSKVEDMEEVLSKYKIWKAKNPDPLLTLSENLDPLLREFGVKIKTEVDFDSIMHLGSILLQTLDGKDIDRDFWSTGSKQVIDTAVPLIEMSPKNAIILVDEPERSLYPDIEKQIIDFYTSLTTDCQFFYATHSPIIASSFDPWEIVELKFDADNRYVIQETNYEGERHVDNYTVYPKYQRWDRILMNLFDLKEEGNSKVRQEEMLNAVMLKHEIEGLVAAKKNKGKAFKEKVEQFELLSKKLDFYAEP